MLALSRLLFIAWGCCLFTCFIAFTLRFGFFLGLLVLLLVLVAILITIILLELIIPLLGLDPQIVLQRVWDTLIDDHPPNLKVLLESLPLLEFLNNPSLYLLISLHILDSVLGLDTAEEVEEGISVDNLIDDSGLAGLFVLLFLLDLLFCEVFALLPLDDGALAFDWGVVLQDELLLQLFVLEEGVLREGEHDLEVVGALLVHDVDVVQVFQGLVVVLGDLFLQDVAVLHGLQPVLGDLPRRQLGVDGLELLLAEELLLLLEFLNGDGLVAVDDGVLGLDDGVL